MVQPPTYIETQEQQTHRPSSKRARRIRGAIYAAVAFIAACSFTEYQIESLIPGDDVEPFSDPDLERMSDLEDDIENLPQVQAFDTLCDTDGPEPAQWQPMTPSRAIPWPLVKAVANIEAAMGGSAGDSVKRRFWDASNRTMVTFVWLGPALNGWPGMVHGGAIATILERESAIAMEMHRQHPARTPVTSKTGQSLADQNRPDPDPASKGTPSITIQDTITAPGATLTSLMHKSISQDYDYNRVTSMTYKKPTFSNAFYKLQIEVDPSDKTVSETAEFTTAANRAAIAHQGAGAGGGTGSSGGSKRSPLSDGFKETFVPVRMRVEDLDGNVCVRATAVLKTVRVSVAEDLESRTISGW